MVNCHKILHSKQLTISLSINGLFNDSQNVRNFGDNAAGCRVVRSLHNLVELGNSQTSDNFFLILRVADSAFVILNPDCVAFVVFRFLSHNFLVLYLGFHLFGCWQKANITIILQPVCPADEPLQADLSFLKVRRMSHE